MRLSGGDLNQQRWPILRWLVPWDFEAAASIKDKDPQNGYGKPTQESPHTGQGLTMEKLECTLAERPKRAPRERARTQSRKRERQNSLERTGTLQSREKLLLGRVVLVYFKGNLYITKSWSVTINVATLTLSHVSSHVITIFFSWISPIILK